MQTSDNPRIVEFGGKQIELPVKFNLGELRDISVISAEERPSDLAGLEKWQFDSFARILEAATRRTATPLKVDDVYLTETSFDELAIARLKILRHSELFKPGKPKQGEAEAAA